MRRRHRVLVGHWLAAGRVPEEDPMHAALVRANIPGGVTDARAKNLREEVIPMVSSAPGFVAGYWTDVVDDKGFAFVVFNDEASAKAAAPPPGTDMGEGVTIEYVDFREILGNA
jgi:hypothetical protein